MVTHCDSHMLSIQWSYMAYRRPCRYAGCPRLTEGKYCQEHMAIIEQRRQRELASKEAWQKAFYRSSRWKHLRQQILRDNPICRYRGRHCSLGATEVHHIESAYEHPQRALDPANLVALCHRCHSEVTFRESYRKERITFANC